jgi:hypothetical protein
MRERDHLPWFQRSLAVLFVVVITASSGWAKPRKRGPWAVGKVVQLTIDGVYVDLGARFGLRSGDEIQLRSLKGSWATLKITGISTKHAYVPVPPDALPTLGAAARAKWRKVTPPPPRPASAPLRPPEPLPQLTSRWEGVDRSRPQLVGYRPSARRGEGPPPRGVHGALRLEYLGLMNLGSDEPQDYHQLGLSSTLEVPRLLADWLDYAHHLRVRFHLARDLDARPFGRSRPELLVYRLRFGINLHRFQAQLGRMLGASMPGASVVDGASVRAQLLPWLYVGGFGGVLPRSDDLRPDVDGSHFGAYAALRLDGRSGWSVTGDMGVLGSTWQGELDRRAISARAAFDWSRLSLAASAVIDHYGEHPSRTSGVELSQLSLLAEGQLTRWLRLGARFDRYLFIPTLESLATYPAEFIEGGAVSSVRGHGDLQLGTQVSLGLQAGFDRQEPKTDVVDSWTFWSDLTLRLRGLLGGDEQLRVSALVYEGVVLSGFGGRLSYLQPLSDWLSLSLDYGLHRDRYAEISDSAVLRHDAAVGSEATVGRRWLLTTEARLIASEEETLLQLLAMLAFSL